MRLSLSGCALKKSIALSKASSKFVRPFPCRLSRVELRLASVGSNVPSRLAELENEIKPMSISSSPNPVLRIEVVSASNEAISASIISLDRPSLFRSPTSESNG